MERLPGHRARLWAAMTPSTGVCTSAPRRVGLWMVRERVPPGAINACWWPVMDQPG
jgi:hypothetical protein